MGKGPRNYTDVTKKRLFGLSGNQCSFPGCSNLLVNEINAINSNICHIEGAKFGSPRYRDDMSDKERADYDNLILLCPQHHRETDDEKMYTVSILKDMKQKHVSRYLHEKIMRNPSMLMNAVNAIADIDIENNIEQEKIHAFDIKSKLNYNNVKRYAPLIQEYKVYHYKINSLYNELERHGSLKKNKILLAIRNYYLKAKGNYVNSTTEEMEPITEHADDIIDNVLGNLYDKLEGCGLFEDDIILGVDLIIVDAFMRCKILEEPK